MADTKPKRINVSGTVSPELDEFIENYRWSNRLTKSQVINVAMDEWAKAHGFTESANGAAEAAEDAGEGNDTGATPETTEDAPEPAPASAGTRGSRRSR